MGKARFFKLSQVRDFNCDLPHRRPQPRNDRTQGGERNQKNGVIIPKFSLRPGDHPPATLARLFPQSSIGLPSRLPVDSNDWHILPVSGQFPLQNKG